MSALAAVAAAVAIAGCGGGGGGSQADDERPLSDFAFFAATDGVQGDQVWVTDGTAEGTQPVTDLQPSAGLAVSGLAAGVRHAGRFWFAANGAAGEELYASDGTPGGTGRVQDINPSGNAFPAGFRVLDGILYFTATDGTTGTRIWRVAGAGPEATDLVDASASLRLVATTDTGLYATGPSSTDGSTELYGGEPSAALAQLTALEPASGSAGIGVLGAIGDTLLFGAKDGDGRELWRSDGTAGSTTQVEDIYPGSEDGVGAIYDSATLDGQVYFRGENDTVGSEPWVSDGTAAGTDYVDDFAQGIGTPPPGSYPSSFERFDGAMYIGLDGALGRTTGSDISVVTTAGGDPLELDGRVVATAGRLFFAATVAGVDGLWVLDGDGEEPRALVEPEPAQANAIDVVATGAGGVVFGVETAAAGCEPWFSDGTVAGTHPLGDLNTGPDDGISGC